jgi:hypothetical protein
MRGLRAHLPFVVVRRERRGAFKDKISTKVDVAVNPHPNPLPMGEGISFLSPFFLPGEKEEQFDNTTKPAS